MFCGALSKGDKLAATGGEDDKAYVWDTVSGDILFECTGHKDSVIFSDFNHDDSFLATADMSGIIQIWKMSDKSVVWNYDMGDISVGKLFLILLGIKFKTIHSIIKIFVVLVDAVASCS